MELSKWKRRRFTPTWGDNHEEPEPCVIVFSPPSVGWMARWREIVAGVPKTSEEDSFVDRLEVWAKDGETFRAEMFEDLILGIENLTLDGKDVSRTDAVEFIQDNEGLREEVFLAIIAEGTLTKDEGKG